MNTHIVGQRGEDAAIEHLKQHGYTILDRNFRSRFGEIDVIAWDGEYVAFIEVKARKDYAFGTPREAVNWHKQQTIIKCAEYWLFKNKRVGVPVRFDVVEVLPDKINHIVDAFRL